jgi:hypothetical protein
MDRLVDEVTPQEKAREKPLKKCKCGHDRNHPMVSATGDYTFGGWCLILFGISAKPRAIRFTCRRCDQVIERVTDPQTISEMRLWG